MIHEQAICLLRVRDALLANDLKEAKRWFDLMAKYNGGIEHLKIMEKEYNLNIK